MSETSKQTKSVSLVLGSGGARGYVHIGVIQSLLDNGYKIESISGCSMGALVGGIFAAGKLEEFESWAKEITQLNVLSLMDISWGRGGLLKGDKVIDTLTDLVGDCTIESLDIKYTAVAVDIKRRREVWITDGPLFDAIRASVSLPLFMKPHTVNGVQLMDGGVLNPIPIAPTFGDNTQLTIAVDLSGPHVSNPKIELPVLDEEKIESPVQKKILGFIDQFGSALTENSSDESTSFMEVANESFEAMQESISRHKISAYPPDELIVFPYNCCGMLDFHRASEMIDVGVATTEAFIDRIRNA